MKLFPWTEFHFVTAYARHDLRVVRPIERRRAGEQHVRDHAHRPDVAFLIVRPRQDLGRDVINRSVHGRHGLRRGENLGEAEVDQLQLRLLGLVGVDPVLQLQIPVNIIILVQVAGGR